jgi:hypothetical protein
VYDSQGAFGACLSCQRACVYADGEPLAELTSIAAANIGWDFLALMARNPPVA